MFLVFLSPILLIILIRRLKNSIGPSALLKIAHGLFLSKLRYGLQLLGQVRWNSQDPLNKDLDAIQKCQNKLLRSLNGSSKLVMVYFHRKLKFTL